MENICRTFYDLQRVWIFVVKSSWRKLWPWRTKRTFTRTQAAATRSFLWSLAGMRLWGAWVPTRPVWQGNCSKGQGKQNLSPGMTIVCSCLADEFLHLLCLVSHGHQASEMQLWILSIHCWALCPSWAQKLYTRLLVLSYRTKWQRNR